MKIKALGQTIEHEGEVVLVVKDMPVNCMVLFISLSAWGKIKENVVIEENDHCEERKNA